MALWETKAKWMICGRNSLQVNSISLITIGPSIHLHISNIYNNPVSGSPLYIGLSKPTYLTKMHKTWKWKAFVLKCLRIWLTTVGRFYLEKLSSFWLKNTFKNWRLFLATQKLLKFYGDRTSKMECYTTHLEGQ